MNAPPGSDLAGPAPAGRREDASPLEITLAYHERSKHHPARLAPSLGFLDWATQPDPFRRFEGAPLVPLDLAPPDSGPRFELVLPIRTDEEGSRPERHVLGGADVALEGGGGLGGRAGDVRPGAARVMGPGPRDPAGGRVLISRGPSPRGGRGGADPCALAVSPPNPPSGCLEAHIRDHESTRCPPLPAVGMDTEAHPVRHRYTDDHRVRAVVSASQAESHAPYIGATRRHKRLKTRQIRRPQTMRPPTRPAHVAV